MRPVVKQYFDFTPTDRALAFLDHRSRVTFHLVVELEGTISSDQLATTWLAMVARHPILSAVVDIERPLARWVPHRSAPSFAVFDDLAVERNRSTVVAALVEKSLSISDGPVVALAQVRCSDGEVLVLSVHHAAFDGPAAIGLLDEVRSGCVELDAGRPIDSTVDLRPRATMALVENAGLSIGRQRSVLAAAQQRWLTTPASTHRRITLPPRPEASRYVLSTESTEALGRLRATGGWTMTEILLVVASAAWDELAGGDDAYEPLGRSGWLVTGDSRRRLGAHGGLGNLSGTELVTLPLRSTIDRDALDVCSRQLSELRDGYFGLATELAAWMGGPVPAGLANAGLSLAFSEAIERGFHRSFSNFGLAAERLTTWPSARARALWWATPAGDPPFVNLSWTSLGGELTLSARGLAPTLGPAIERIVGRLAEAVAASAVLPQTMKEA